MNLRSSWALGLVAAAALVGTACGSTQPASPFGGDDGGAGDGSVMGDSGPGFGDGGSFGDGGPNHDSGPPPKTCDPSCQAAGGTCVMNVCVIQENPGNVSPMTQGQLKGGGTADAGFQWLYPYDKTVFPRGLVPPTMQWGGTVPDALYIHISAQALTYDGFYGAAAMAPPLGGGAQALSAAVWKALTIAVAPSTATVQVTKISGGQVTGPITETWTLAEGSLRGTIYYETYESQLLGGPGSVGIMKIQPGATAPTPVKSGCGNVCHTASADGSTLVANTVLGFGSASYDLKNNAATIFAASGEIFTYGGIYPDGSFVVSATDYRTWTNGPSLVYDTKTGAQITVTGWNITRSGTPAFSPDGKFIAFNHEDTGGGHTLATMSYDKASKTFSALADIASDSANTLAWPAFTPDSKSVIYHAGSNPQFETDAMATGDVYWVDLASKMTARLDALDGYGPNGQTYLPAMDPHLSFAPTVLPEAVGGYFWVVFTSHRSYGNTLASMAAGPSGADEDGKLWVAAFDLLPTAGKDASHPAFYLDGQESTADNLRGFWVLDPCKADGSDCNSGDECCNGYCRSNDGGPSMCVPPPGGCSMVYEHCNTAADCCDMTNICVNNRCAVLPK